MYGILYGQVGSLIGVAIFGTIVAIASQLTSGIHVTLWISAILFAVVAFSALIVMRPSSSPKDRFNIHR